MPDVSLYGQEWQQLSELSTVDFNNDDYRARAAQLLPQGRAWNRDPNSLIQRLLHATVRTFARIERRAYELFYESIPSRTTEMLDTWEEFAGLPGDCDTNPPVSEDARRQVLVAKLTTAPIPSEANILAIAANMGYENAEIITYFDPFLCTSPCNHAVQEQGTAWTYAYTIALHESNENDTAFQCAILDISHQHTQVFFDFTP